MLCKDVSFHEHATCVGATRSFSVCCVAQLLHTSVGGGGTHSCSVGTCFRTFLEHSILEHALVGTCFRTFPQSRQRKKHMIAKEKEATFTEEYDGWHEKYMKVKVTAWTQPLFPDSTTNNIQIV